VQSIAMSLSVCLSVRSHNSITTRLNFINLSVLAARGRGSVFLWRRCDMPSTSGFVDDLMFSHNGRMGVMRVTQRQQNTAGATEEIPPNFCRAIKSSK